jgi:hypothetical protein
MTKTCDREHDFTLVLSGIRELTPEVENALFEAGCNDATLSMRRGVPYLTFSRAAPMLKDAILSAVQDIRRANIGADVVRVDTCDLVTQAEIAHRIECSRQQVHQYVSGARGPGGFPAPVCQISEGTPLWQWCDVASWLHENQLVSEETVLDARQTALINAVLDLMKQKDLNPDLTNEVFEALKCSL